MDNRICWDEYFMEIAKVVSIRSPDNKRKVGCVIVDKNNRIVSTGYNGMVSGMNDTEIFLPENRDKIYNLIIHAEMNAILYSKTNLEGCKMYTTLSPCVNCLKYIKTSGINDIYYLERHNKSYKDTVEANTFMKLNLQSLNYEL